MQKDTGSFSGSFRDGADRTLQQRVSFDSRVAASSWDANPWKAMVKTASFDGRDEPGCASAAAAAPRINEAVVIVDPFSSGAILAQLAVLSGRHCIRVLSESESPVAAMISENAMVSFDATVQHDDRLADQTVATAQTSKIPSPAAATRVTAERGSYRMGWVAG